MRDSDVPIRASILRGLPALVDELGGPGDDFLATFGVDTGLTRQHDAFLSVRLVERILEDAAVRFAVPDLGLRMAARQDPHVLGPLAIAMENSRTIGDALDCANRFLFVLSPALSQEVIPDPLENPAVVGIRLTNNMGNGSAQAIDYALGMEHRVMTLVSGGGLYGLRSVHLPHPPLAPESAYREHFGTDVAFDRPHAVLRVPRQLLGVEVSGGNDLLRDIAVEFLETHFGHDDVPVSDLVRAILAEQPGPDRPDLTKAARLLSLHPRSLQRLLAAEGVGFKHLLDQVRRDEAHALIVNTDLSFSQIAARIGLQEQSSLTHAAQRWFGMSPSHLRRTPDDVTPRS